MKVDDIACRPPSSQTVYESFFRWLTLSLPLLRPHNRCSCLLQAIDPYQAFIPLRSSDTGPAQFFPSPKVIRAPPLFDCSKCSQNAHLPFDPFWIRKRRFDRTVTPSLLPSLPPWIIASCRTKTNANDSFIDQIVSPFLLPAFSSASHFPPPFDDRPALLKSGAERRVAFRAVFLKRFWTGSGIFSPSL